LEKDQNGFDPKHRVRKLAASSASDTHLDGRSGAGPCGPGPASWPKDERTEVLGSDGCWVIRSTERGVEKAEGLSSQRGITTRMKPLPPGIVVAFEEWLEVKL
jgi:hypothetical protein